MSVAIPIQTLTPEQKVELRKILLVEPKLDYMERKNLEKRHIKIVPIECFKVVAGVIRVPLTFGRSYCAHHRIQYYVYQHEQRVVLFYPNLYETQVPLYDAMMSQLATFLCVLLNLPTGTGKTLFGVKATADLEAKTIVVVTKNTYKDQWVTAYKENSSAKVAVVGECSERELYEADVIIAMLLRIGKLPYDLRKPKLLILDEVHEIAVPSAVDPLLNLEPHHVIAMSATPTAKYMAFIKLIIGNNEIVKKVDKKWTLYKFNTGVVPTIQYRPDGTLDWNIVVKSTINHQQYLFELFEFLRLNYTKKTLVLCPEKEYTKLLCEELQRYKYSADYMTSEKPTHLDSQILLATAGKAGTGYDQKNFCKNWDGVRIEFLILLVDTKSIKWLVQMFGRSFRSKRPVVVWFINNFGTSDDHFKEAKKEIVNMQPCRWQEISIPCVVESLWPVEPDDEREKPVNDDIIEL